MKSSVALAEEDRSITIEPQPGPQTAFCASRAEVVFYGGAAGGGKTYGLLIDPLRYYRNPDVGGVIFRKTNVQVKIEGGLWDESMRIYPHLDGTPREQLMEWKFPTRFGMSFAHIEHEREVFNYQGAQIAWEGFDELTHFSRKTVFYMLSRNRSTADMKPRFRGTCNPDPDSFVRQMIDWWIGEDGFPILERSGIVRWFLIYEDKMYWAATRAELIKEFGPKHPPKSFTFIPAKLSDNQILMRKDPGYLANLLAQDNVTRQQLLDGNWNIRVSAGSLFKRGWFEVVDAIPANPIRAVRFWDRAATAPYTENEDPDWTRGLLMLKYENGTYCVADLQSMRASPAKVEALVKNIASQDGYGVEVKSQQDPGSAGVSEALHFTTMLAGHIVNTETMPKDKITRAKPVSAQCEVGNIKILRGEWNDEFFRELENFPDGKHDDIVDTLSGAFNHLSGGLSLADVL